MRAVAWGLLALMSAGCDDTVAEICGNGIDDDLDGLTDCEEALCRCSSTEICDGGLDEDDDGLIDCADDDCADDEACIEDLCDDGLDDDGDGLTDCADPDCDGACPEVCDDGRDNDGNGLVDCEDAACVDHELCGELLCDDGTDDDGDGLVDCDDSDCWDLDCHPSGIRTQVTGGTVELVDVFHSSSTATFGTYSTYMSGTTVDIACGDGESSSTFSNASAARFLNIQGVARVVVNGNTETCSWSFDELLANGEDGTLTPGERAGFTISDASRCRLTGTDWLPVTLTRRDNEVFVGSVLRYGMNNPMTRFQTASDHLTSTIRESCYRSVNTYTRSDTVYGAAFGDELLNE